MFGRQSVVDRKRTHAGGSAGLAYQPAMTTQRTRTTTAAMKVEEHTTPFTSGCGRPLARDAAEIDTRKCDIGRNRLDRSDFVDPRAPLGETLRPRLGTQ